MAVDVHACPGGGAGRRRLAAARIGVQPGDHGIVELMEGGSASRCLE
jgi:hypothetical protein